MLSKPRKLTLVLIASSIVASRLVMFSDSVSNVIHSNDFGLWNVEFPKGFTPEALKQLQADMSEEEVTQLLGIPFGVQPLGRFERCLVYAHGKGWVKWAVFPADPMARTINICFGNDNRFSEILDMTI